MKVVALTGGVASGKTEILEEASLLPGVETVQADDLAKEAYRPGTSEYRRIVELLGGDILDEEGEVDTSRVAEIIFNSKEKRKGLEDVIHPFVRERVDEIIADCREEGVEVLLVEIPLLFQSSAIDESIFDAIVLVHVDERTKLERLMERDGISEEEAASRIEAQKLPPGVEGSCDEVVSTSGTLKETRESARELIKTLID